MTEKLTDEDFMHMLQKPRPQFDTVIGISIENVLFMVEKMEEFISESVKSVDDSEALQERLKEDFLFIKARVFKMLRRVANGH